MTGAISETIRLIRAEQDGPEVAVKPRPPRVTATEAVVGYDALPQGPRAVANAVDKEWWSATWLRSEAELLDGPKRGGEAFGLRFVSADGKRRGWAVWIDRTFLGAFLYIGRTIVPRQLSAKELKSLLSGASPR